MLGFNSKVKIKREFNNHLPAKGTCKNQIVNQNYRDQLFEIEATSWEQVWCAQLSERNGKKKPLIMDD